MSIFGQILSRSDVEKATIDLINRWMRTYMAEIERINDLKPGEIPRPPTPESIYGGVDFGSYLQDLMPSIIVVCHPVGETERTGSIGYTQTYEVEVGSLVLSDDEDSSRWYADLYGAAIMGAILQGNYVEDWVQDVVMVGSPDTTLPQEDQRRLAQCVVTFHVVVGPIIDGNQGPAVPYPPDSPQYGGDPDAPFHDWPTVSATNVVVVAESLDDEQ